MRAIGVIRTPFTDPAKHPIPREEYLRARGTVEVFPQFAEGLDDIEGFSHLYLLFVFHHSREFKLRVVPAVDDREHGVFATRAPRRPNPLGLSIVRLHARRGNILEVSRLDIFDGAPLLDIKPYIPFVDDEMELRIGWIGDVPGTQQQD